MKKLSLLLIFALVLMSAVIPTSALAADDYVWLKTNGTDFNSYSATESNPAFPSGFGGANLGSNKVFATTVDDAHGVSVAVKGVDSAAPWFAVETRDGNDLTTETNLLKYSLEFYANKLSSMSFHGLGQITAGGSRAFNDFFRLGSDGKVNYLDGTSGTYQAKTWYTVEIIVDIPNQQYSVNFGQTGSTLTTAVNKASLKTGWRNVTSFRITTQKGGDMVYDNFFTYKSVLSPEVTAATYDKENKKIQITFNKEMKADTINSNSVYVEIGNENVKVPYSGTYDDKVYTITLQEPLPENMECRLSVSGVKCADDIDVKSYYDVIANGNSYIAAGNVTFTKSSDSVSASVTVPDSLSSAVKKLVLVGYAVSTDSDYSYSMLISYDVKDIVSSTTQPVSLSCTGENINGAAVYALDENFAPVCDCVKMSDGEMLTGMVSTTLPSASAQLKYDATKNDVTVYGTANPGEMIAVIGNRSNKANLNDICDLHQTIAKDNGYWEISFKIDTSMKDAQNYKFPSDDYYVHVISASSATTLPFKYSNSVEAKAAMDDVQKAKTTSDIESIIARFTKVFALDLTEYNTLDKENVQELILSEPLSTYTEGAQFKGAFERAVFLEMMNEDEFDWDDLEANSDVFEIDTDDIDDTDFIVEFLKKSEYSKKDDFSEKLTEAVMLSKISTAANASKMEDLLLDTYGDELDLLGDSTVSRRYNKINEQTKVFAKMLLDDDERYFSVDEVVSAFEDAVDTVYDSENKKSSSGGGGGGGKTYVASVPSVPTNTVPAEQPIFTDTAANDNAVLKALAESGVVAGYGDGTFRPQGNVRRDEFMKMIVVALGLENNEATAPFTDVPAGNWAYSYVAAAYNAGITTGVGANEFAPASNINRQDVITMIYRACKDRGLIASSADGAVDTTGVADYATEAVKFVYTNITAPGTDGIRPSQPATRIETANLLYEFMEYIKGGK